MEESKIEDLGSRIEAEGAVGQGVIVPERCRAETGSSGREREAGYNCTIAAP